MNSKNRFNCLRDKIYIYGNLSWNILATKRKHVIDKVLYLPREFRSRFAPHSTTDEYRPLQQAEQKRTPTAHSPKDHSIRPSIARPRAVAIYQTDFCGEWTAGFFIGIPR